ncbi:MAG: ArsC family reductase [Steroidobacteraceae bacterium]
MARHAGAVTIYGIANCDTMKKARSWLELHAIEASFHDYRKTGIDHATLARWCRELGWEKVLNRSGTTFRRLSDTERAGLDAPRAIGLMLAQPALIKRPVLDIDGRLLVGFKSEAYAAAFAAS